jgi:hypothetical protein
MPEKINAYLALVENPERKRPLGRLGIRWVISTKTDLGEIGFRGKGNRLE